MPSQLPASSRRLLWAMLFTSFVLHATFAAALLLAHSPSRVGTDEAVHIISVALVAAPSKRELKSEPETDKLQMRPSAPQKPVSKKIKRPPLAKKQPAVVVQKSASAEEISEPVRSAPVAAPANGVATLSSAALETRAQGRAAYGRLVWKKIAEAKPAGLHRKGSVDVRFTIMSDGTLGAVEVLHSRGNSEFEALARETLVRAAPFPPPPPELGQGNISFEIPFNFL